ncbi:MAG: redoxin domain-containing protein [Actinomycetota bacterium]|nr:redoxin domain-containing protein [Actinomycetota bacterium]
MTGRRGTLLRQGPAALALALLTACSAATGSGGGPAATAPSERGITSSTGVAATAAVGAAPLGLEGRMLDGAPFDSGDLAGRPVVLWFWAPWCTICRAEAPEVAELAAEYAGRVEVIGVAGRGDVPSMREFVTATGTGSFPHLVDEDGRLWNQFGVVSQPAFVFVDRSSHTETFAGALGGEDLRAIVDDLAAG